MESATQTLSKPKYMTILKLLFLMKTQIYEIRS